MSTIGHLSRTLRKRTYICSDCRKWLATQSSQNVQRVQQQRRSISQAHLRNIKVAEEGWNKRKQGIDEGEVKSVLEVLEERGLVNQIVGTRDSLHEVLKESRVGVYCGVDPTAPSLHVGHIVPFMALGWMYIHGYSVTFLLGGFTARVGDPTDRLTARAEKNGIERRQNMLSMFEQLKKFATFMERYADRRGYQREWAWRRAVKNNAEWYRKLTLSDFLTQMAKYIRVGPMLGRDSVKNRLEKGDGMSFAEFTYPLIQGWDWWHQYQTGTQIQIGGSDQFGNILAGADAVKAIMKEDLAFMQKHSADRAGLQSSGDPMGFTVPLLTTSSGEKFGKSAGNAIWIDPQLTSSFDLYQFFLRCSDDDVERYLKLLTFLPIPQINKTMAEHKQDESQRIAQHKLASEFVELVHGHIAASEAEQQHRSMFSKDLSIEDIKAQMNTVKPFTSTPDSDGRPEDFHPSLNKHAPPLRAETTSDINIKLPRSLVVQQSVPRILWSAGLAASRSEGQRLVNNRGVYVGGRIGKEGVVQPLNDVITYRAITDSKWSAIEPYVVDDDLLVLRTGKWKKKFIQIVSDEQYEKEGLSCPGWREEPETPEDPIAQADLEGEEMYRAQGQKNVSERERRRVAKESYQSRGFGEVRSARFAPRVGRSESAGR